MMKLHRLTPLGIDQFSNYLDQLRADGKLSPPLFLLQDASASEPIADVEVEEKQFINRLDAAHYLYHLLESVELTSIDKDSGLWSWLSLFYFDQLCPVKKGSSRVAAVIDSYIPNITTQRRLYRHLLLGPWQLFRLHNDKPDRLRAHLCSKLNVSTSEVYRMFIETGWIASSKASVEVATTLYFNQETKGIKRGTGSKINGGCRRLIEYLQQIDRTYDITCLSPKLLIEILPDEFDKFKPKQKELFID